MPLSEGSNLGIFYVNEMSLGNETEKTTEAKQRRIYEVRLGEICGKGNNDNRLYCIYTLITISAQTVLLSLWSVSCIFF